MRKTKRKGKPKGNQIGSYLSLLSMKPVDDFVVKKTRVFDSIHLYNCALSFMDCARTSRN